MTFTPAATPMEQPCEKILIFGAGQAGLQLALSLLTHGYEVTAMSATTPYQIRAGCPQGTPALFAPALAAERLYSLNLFDGDTPPLYGTRVSVAGPAAQPVLAFNAEFERPGASTDPRVKTAAWLELADRPPLPWASDEDRWPCGRSPRTRGQSLLAEVYAAQPGDSGQRVHVGAADQSANSGRAGSSCRCAAIHVPR